MNTSHSYISFVHKLFCARILVVAAAASVLFPACKKFVTIDEPINTITTENVFSTDAQANSAMAGVFTQMINGKSHYASSSSGYSCGLSTLLGALSSDELVYYTSLFNDFYAYNINRIPTSDVPSGTMWTTAYAAISGCNAVIEGTAASASSDLRDSVRSVLTGEAKFVRAFSYFYLTNFFGDVPLALTTDYNKTAGMSKTPQAEVYRQIIEDLKDAKTRLQSDYSTSGGERYRPNKYAATALLARVYLFTGDNTNAALQSAEVIAQAGMYNLEPLNNVFLKNSPEAIWQLQQNVSNDAGTAISEGIAFIANPVNTGRAPFYFSDNLLAAFEATDQRRNSWVGYTDFNLTGTVKRYYYPFKYKIGRSNYVVNGNPSEYYMVLRLGEQFLIHAEASAKTGGTGIDAAIKDLNKIRSRSGLADLSPSLTQEQVLTAVAKERQTELFAEWGHRWLDLKRTGKAHDVLSVIPLKQPWTGDYQLLYPIPVTEIKNNIRLKQNIGYN